MGTGLIKVDEHFIEEVRDKLEKLRGQVATVRNGVNPNDPGHPTGLPFNGLATRPGWDNFQPGVALKTKLTSLGGLVDTKLAQFDTKMSTYIQGLTNILATSENLELANTSASEFGSFLTGSAPNP
ncbi:hypothetical protein [Dactylosporangium darangshiense]